MHPTFIDLSQFKPFGLSLESMAAKAVGLVILALAGMLISGLLARQRAKRKGKWPGAGEVMCVLALTALGVGLLWIVGKVHSYGLMMAIGFLAAMGVGRWLARRCGEDPEIINSLGLRALVGGIVGARLSYVIEHWRDFTERVVDVFKLTSGGLVFDGGLILAIVWVLAHLIRRRLPVRRLLDIMAVCVMIGLAFGRVGCLLNGCCYGRTVSSHFALGMCFPYSGRPLAYPRGTDIRYPQGASASPVYSEQFARGASLHVPPELVGETVDGTRVLKQPDALRSPDELAAAGYAWSLPVQPAQLYGMVNALVLAGLLYLVLRLRSREGQVFAMLFVLYPISRFVLELIRDDNPGMDLTPAQVKCLVLLAVGAAMLLALRRLPASCGPTFAQREVAARKPAPKSAAPGRKRPGRQGRL
jgi:phosphatidylglycerol---prolipoprotein diacylglyceryl transferase